VADRFTLDTNILVYAVDSSAAEKHRMAGKVLLHAAATRQPLMLQALNEFAAVVCRKQTTSASLMATALRFHEKSFVIVPPSMEDLFTALRVQEEHHIAFWDALLWATARRSGCRIVLSEDFQDGRTLNGVLFVNPFNLSMQELKAQIAKV